MDTLSTLFLQSARQYSALADNVFGDSVQQSQFASSVSNMRMQVAKAITSTALDIQIDLNDEDIEFLNTEADWQSCIAFDNLLMREMAAHDEAKFLPLLAGVFVIAHQGAAYASPVDDRPKYKQCLGCGAISEQWECPICGNGKNWLTGVEVPENTEEPETIVAASEEVSLPNLSFADFPPEMPAQPKRWEVLLNTQEDDIFKATGLARPTLG